MKDDLRGQIAYVAGRLITQQSFEQLYDYRRSRLLIFKGAVTRHQVQVEDQLGNCAIRGESNDSYFRLEASQDGLFVDLVYVGAQFSGVVHPGSTTFSGKVSGTMIYLFDSDDSQNFLYSIEH